MVRLGAMVARDGAGMGLAGMVSCARFPRCRMSSLRRIGAERDSRETVSPRLHFLHFYGGGHVWLALP